MQDLGCIQINLAESKPGVILGWGDESSREYKREIILTTSFSVSIGVKWCMLSSLCLVATCCLLASTNKQHTFTSVWYVTAFSSHSYAVSWRGWPKSGKDSIHRQALWTESSNTSLLSNVYCVFLLNSRTISFRLSKPRNMLLSIKHQFWFCKMELFSECSLSLVRLLRNHFSLSLKSASVFVCLLFWSVVLSR